KFKQTNELTKTDYKKSSNIRGIPKLDDAHFAGCGKGKECYLFLTEGDSAKSLVVAGMSVIGRQQYGVFPLRGKPPNVREAKEELLLKNEEFKNIKQILGLRQNKIYTDTSKLRYSGIIIMTDQDVDGSHIKGLIVNMLHYFWPSLLKIKDFVRCFVTPIVKVYKKSDKKKKDPIVFYNLVDYKKWYETEYSKNKWEKPKYYKGLGTSDNAEAKEMFSDFENHII